MSPRRNPLTHVLRTLAIGAALLLAAPVGVQALDAIDDPVRQPHLKSWSNVIPNANRRFVVLADFNNEAVLDRETGLVWEKSPGGGPNNWENSASHCHHNHTAVGGRLGWRLPSVVELASLIDPNATEPPYLPAGHPFTNVQAAEYWSATTDAVDPTLAWYVTFFNGFVGFNDKSNLTQYAWCVRSPMNAHQY